ncbi:MAG: DUF2877 domain-containing protein [Streptosporangiaceae bacterium]
MADAALAAAGLAGQAGEQPPGRPWPPVAGMASLGVRSLVSGPRHRARVIAAFPAAIYLELRAPGPEPRVVALVTPAAIRLPIAVIAAPRRLPGRGATLDGGFQPALAGGTSCFPGLAVGGDAFIGGGVIETGCIRVRVRRWWDPSPVLASLSRPRLERGCAALQALCAASPRRPGLDVHAGPAVLAACCAAADLTRAADAAKGLVGLGPGLTPSGDDMLAGLLLALRLLGGATPGGAGAVWLADQLAAAVTCYARGRTTPVSATLLHCAARGQGSAEAASVLRALGGREPAGPAATRLLATGHTSGADLAWGLVAGCRAVLALSA